MAESAANRAALAQASRNSEQAAVESAKRLLTGSVAPEAPVVEETEGPEAPENVEAEEAVVEEQFAQLPDLDPDVPEDVENIWNEPDFNEEDEVEDNEEEDETYLSEDAQEERRKRIALEKRLAWVEEQRIEAERGAWLAEAEKYAPLATPFLADIQAKSRKGFLKEAKRIHSALRPYVDENFVKPYQEQKEVLRAQMEAEVRAEVEAAWGKPTTGPGGVPVKAEERRSAYEQARASHDLVGMIKAKSTDIPL